MFEGVLEKLLLKVFGDYVQEFNRDQLKVSIWAGDVVLTDLQLKVGALDSFRLPIDVLAGQISTLTIQIPWTRIASSPVQITIDGLFVLCGPQRAGKQDDKEDHASEVDAGVSAAAGLAWALKQRLLEQHEQAKRAAEEADAAGDGGDGKQSQSYSARIIGKIIANLQLTVKHVHLRYEDATTLRGAAPPSAVTNSNANTAPSSSSSATALIPVHSNASPPRSQAFAAGFTIGELVAQTTDSTGLVRFVASETGGAEPVTYKLVELKAGAVYWNSEVPVEELWQNLDGPERIRRMKQMETHHATSTPLGAAAGGGEKSVMVQPPGYTSKRPTAPAPSPTAPLSTPTLPPAPAPTSTPSSASSSSAAQDFTHANAFGYDYILHPLDITMRAVLHHGENDTELLKVQEAEHQLALAAKGAASSSAAADPFPLPHSTTTTTTTPTSKYFLSFTLPHLSLQLRSSQYRDCVRILDHFSQAKVSQQIAARMAKLPKFPGRGIGHQLGGRRRKQSIASSVASAATVDFATTTRSPAGRSRTHSFAGEEDETRSVRSTRSGRSRGNSMVDGGEDAGEEDDDTMSMKSAKSYHTTTTGDGDDDTRSMHSAKSFHTAGSASGSDNDDDLDDEDALASDSEAFLTPTEQSPLGTPLASPLATPSDVPSLTLTAASLAAAASASSSRTLRPTWCRPYWKHAIRCLILLKSRRSRLDWSSVREYSLDRKRYIALWMRSYNAAQVSASAQTKKSVVASFLDPLSTDEQRELQATERKLSYESVVVFRAIAEQQWRVAQQMATKLKKAPTGKSSAEGASATAALAPAPSASSAAKKGAGWWGLLGYKAGDDGALGGGALDGEAAKLLASITLTPEQQRRIWEQEQRLPLFFKKLQLEVNLIGADFRLTQPDPTTDWAVAVPLRHRPQVEVTRITWDGHLSLTQRLKNWSARVAVTRLEVTDCSTVGTCFPKVLSSGSAHAANAKHAQPLLSIHLDDAPRLLDSSTSADFRVVLRLQPLAVVISPLYLAAVMRFFYEKETTAYLWAAAANWEKQARNDLLTALTDHREVDIDVQVRQPTVLLPIDCLKRTSTVLVSDLDMLSMVSRPPAKSKKVAADSASAGGGGGGGGADAENSTHVAPLNPMAYDSFQLSFQSCRLYTCASVHEWQEHSRQHVLSRAATGDDEDAPLAHAGQSMLYIVDGAVDEDARVPSAHSMHHASSPPVSASSASASVGPSISHAHPGFDVSLVMYTCIDRWEKLRIKHARDQERARAKRIAEMTAAGDLEAIASLPPLPLSYPLPKILIQGSLPRLNISVCASTLEVIRRLKDQLVTMFFSRPKRSSGVSGEAQTMLQLANENKGAAPTATAMQPGSSIITVRTNLECGFIVDQLVVHVLRDRVARNVRAAAAASPSSEAPASFLNPHAAPLFLLHISRMGGNFVTNSAREITSTFQLASIRILDCLQTYGPTSKFAYLACSYPSPVEEESPPMSMSRHPSSARFGKSPSSARLAHPPPTTTTTDEQVQFSFSAALGKATGKANSSANTPTHGLHSTVAPSTHSSASVSPPVASSSSSSSHLIRIRYRYIFHPTRSDREWEEEEGGVQEEEFLAGIGVGQEEVGLGVDRRKKAPVAPSAVGVSSFIDFDFNTLYVNWNPNTIAAVLAYLRYDETVQTDKETAQVLNAKPTAEGKASEPQAEMDSRKSSTADTLHVPGAASTTPRGSPSREAASPTPPDSADKSSKVANKKGKKSVRLRADSSAAVPEKHNLISPIAATWTSAHKTITVLTARLKKLSITFNKEAENRALWRLEMVHSTVEHRHVVHPSPFLFYLMTSSGTGHRTKKETQQGFISQASKDIAQGRVPGTSSVAAGASSASGSISVSSAHLSRDPLHTFVTKGTLGNVHIYDLDTDRRLKYREMLGLRPIEHASKKPTGGLHVHTHFSPTASTRQLGSSFPSAISATDFSSSPSSPPSAGPSDLVPLSVLDFQFSSYALEVSQRRAYAVSRRAEVEWTEDHAPGTPKRKRSEAEAEKRGEPTMTTPRSGTSTPRPSTSSAAGRFPAAPDFTDTHLLLHVNALRVVYIQQPTMELIDYFNEGILGAFQAQLRRRAPGSASPPSPALQPEKYHKLSVTLSNPQIVLPRNAYSASHAVAGLRQIKVTNTVRSRRLILGVDLQGGTVESGELNADGSFPIRPSSGGVSSSRPPMLELECFVTCILPQPDQLKQPQNEKYFDSITEVDASQMKGTMSWSQYVLLLNIFNENIRAPPPVRPKVKQAAEEVASLPTAARPTANSSSVASSVPPVVLPASLPGHLDLTPSLTDAPTVTYHVFDERPPMTLDIRLRVATVAIKFLLGTGMVATDHGGLREDGLCEIQIRDIEYIFQTFSSRHAHSTAKVHSITMLDIREASRAIPFKYMLCPFAQLRSEREKATFFSGTARKGEAAQHGSPAAPAPSVVRQSSSVNAAAAVSSATSGSSGSPAGGADAELEYVQHDYPSGARDMQLRIFKPCGFVIPDFWMDLISGFLFTANDSAFADQHAMMDEWTRRQLEVNGEIAAPATAQANGGPKSPRSPSASPKPLSTTTGANLPGYTPSAFSTAQRPFRCFNLQLKNSRFIVLEDLMYRHCRALVTTCDATMVYTSEEQQHQPPPADLPKGQPSHWWTSWQWARHIAVTKLRMFVCSSASNPVINAAHSVVTPLNVVLDQTFKTEKRYYEPKNVQYYVHDRESAPPTSESGSLPPHHPPAGSSTARTLSRSSSALLHSPLRLEVHDQLFVDIFLSSASGTVDEPIELRASYQDFKLITNCMESLSEQQKGKEEEQARVKARQAESAQKAKEEAFAASRSGRGGASSSSLHSMYTSHSASGFDPMDTPDQADDEDDANSQQSGLVTPMESAVGGGPTLQSQLLDLNTFQESVQMLHVVWKNQLTFVVINDCFQRYVPLLHARILSGDALCIAKRKELDDTEVDEDDDDEEAEDESGALEGEEASPADQGEGKSAAAKQTALERAKSFLQKLKGADGPASGSSVVPPSKRARSSYAIKNVVDYKTIALTLLVECTYFNPRVVVWEPLVEPCQVELKCQYETPNIKNHSHSQHHSKAFGQVSGMAGAAKRRMRGAVVVHNAQTSSGASSNNVPAWTISLSCASRVNINISYIFLQHLYTTLQSWNADFENDASAGKVTSPQGDGASPVSPHPVPSGSPTADSKHQAFSPYFIRNLTGAEVLYRCRNIIRESTTKGARGPGGTDATSTSNAYALHDRIAMKSEFAEDPESFISPIGPVGRKRVQTASGSSTSRAPSSGSATSRPSMQSRRSTTGARTSRQPSRSFSVNPLSTTRESESDGDASDVDMPDDDDNHATDQETDRTEGPLEDDGLEAVHVLPPGAEEQLSLRLITGAGQRRRKSFSGRSKEGGADDDTEYSAEDDVYRSILASRAPFSLRVRLAGGWVALSDLVVNKVGTTSYVLQLDTSAGVDAFTLQPTAADKPATVGATTVRADSVGGAVSFLHASPSAQAHTSGSLTSLGLASGPPAAAVPSALSLASPFVISDYFPSSPTDNEGPVGPSLGQMLAGGIAGGAAGPAGAVGGAVTAGAFPMSSPRPAPVILPMSSPSASGRAGAASASGAQPGVGGAGAAGAAMLHVTQLGDRRQLLFVDVVLRDGSKVVTLRSPIELVNRTNKPLCFLLHAHPTTARRVIAHLSNSTPYPDWQASNSAFLQTKDAYAVLGPVPAGGTINVPFSLTHLDFVSVMPVSARTAEAQRKSKAAASHTAHSAAGLSGSGLMSSAASVLGGHGTASSAPSSPVEDDETFRWSDTPVSQAALMKQVHEQSARYTAAHATAPPPGVVARLQCHKVTQAATADAPQGQQGMKWRADSSFLLHVQAVHGSSSGTSTIGGSGASGAGAGEDMLTLSLVFTPPFVLRNLFPYGVDFRIAYTRANPATALMGLTHHASASHSQHNVLSVASATQQGMAAQAQVAAAQKQPKLTDDQKKRAKETEKVEKERAKEAERAQKLLLKHEKANPSGSSMPGRLDLAHPHTNGKAKYELWGHLASGQHLYFDHLNLDRDPYLMFRLDGFGWSERVPLGHLNPEDLHEAAGVFASGAPTPGQASQPGDRDEGKPLDYTVSSYLMKQHVARHYVTIEDNNGNPLIAQLESRRAGPQGGGLELDMYVQYWLINRTGLDLLYGSRIQTSESEQARSVIRTLPGHGGRVELCTYENQRYSVLDGWSSPFLPTDRPAWSDEEGNDRPKEWFRLPADDGSWMFEGDWHIDYGSSPDTSLQVMATEVHPDHASMSRQTDGNGWEYSVDFPWAFHPKNQTMDAVRRRKWIRSYVSTRSLKPLCLHSTNIRGFKEELCVRVSPLTRGGDYQKEMHTKSGPCAPLVRVRMSDSPWSLPFTASGNNDGLLLIQETQTIDVANDVDLEAAKWKRAAAHVMQMADAGLEKGKFQLQGDEKELGPLAPHVSPRATYARTNRYDIGVSFTSCPGIFHRTQMISFTPRFVLVNQLPYTLFFRQAGAHHRGRVPVLNIDAGKFQPFWWQDIGQQPLGAESAIRGQPGAPPPPAVDPRAKVPPLSSAEFEARKQHLKKQNVDYESLASIAFASSAAVRWRWTGAFPIDEVGELSIACRSSAMTSRFLRVKVMLEGATVFVLFQEENLAKPRYRLDNLTDCPMWYRQKLPYVNDSREQVLASLPLPPQAAISKPAQPLIPQAISTPNLHQSAASPHPSGSPFSPSATASAVTQSQSASSRPAISSESLSPWLYLGPGESTPFAWQEILVKKPYDLEIVTTTPWVQSEGEANRREQEAAAMAKLAHDVALGTPTPQATPGAPNAPPTYQQSSSVPTTPSSGVPSFFRRSEQTPQQKRAADVVARERFDASIRAKLGAYTFHLCDSVQLDEIGYSLISMDSQTFIDVYVEDDSSFDAKKRRGDRPGARGGARGGSTDTSSGHPAEPLASVGGAATKIMKLVRRNGVRDLGVAEAAAVLKQEQRTRALSSAQDEERKRKLSTDSASSSTSSQADANSAGSFSPEKPRGVEPPPGDYVPVHRRELQVEKTSLYFDFQLPKLSISLVDHLPRELALFSLRDLKVTYSSSNIYQKVEVLLGDMQVDNQMADAMFPVVLHQKKDAQRVVGQTHSDRRGTTATTALVTTRALPPRPFIHISCIRLTKYSSLEHYKYVGLLIQEFVLKLDQSFILACIPFLDVFYNARFAAPGGANATAGPTGMLDSTECSSMEDLEIALGIPLANEDEYVALAADGRMPKVHRGAAAGEHASGPHGDRPTIHELELDFEQQIAQLSHYKAVLATLQSKLALESAQSHHERPEQAHSIRVLEEDITKTKQQYARLLEANQVKAMQIQSAVQAQAAQAKSSTPAVPSTLGGSPLSSPLSMGTSYRASHVSSVASSWIEGSDQKHQEQKTRHGNPASRTHVPYRGWMQPGGPKPPTLPDQSPTNGDAPGLPAGLSQYQDASSSSAVAAPAAPPIPSSHWVSANSSQNLSVMRTLTALVNATLAKAHRRAARRKRVKKSSHRASASAAQKRTEESTDQIYYLENVEINSVQCVFSFFTLPSYTTTRQHGHNGGPAYRSQGGGDVVPTWFITLGFGSHDSNPELLSAQTQALANAISSKTLMIANAEDAHLKLTGLHITHSFTTISYMTSLLAEHYKRQLNMQLFELVGASHVLGNPIGLISNLGTGVFDLVNEPISGAIKGPAAFGKGVAVGVGSFFKYSVRGVASTASSLLGTMGNAAATMTVDPEYLRKRKLGRLRQPKHLASGLMDGTRHLAKGFYDGVTGIFTSPVDGAMSEGALGFMKGIGRGLIGVVVKPVTGVFDAVTTVSEGIKNTTTLFEKRVVPQRPARIMYGPDQLMRVYSVKELSASCFLDTRGNLRLAGHQRETYQDHVTLLMAPSKSLLKENDLRIKAELSAEKDLADGVGGSSEPPTPRGGPGQISPSDSPMSTSRRSSISDSDADQRGGLDGASFSIPSGMHLTPGGGSQTERSGSTTSRVPRSMSSSALVPAGSATHAEDHWHVAFVLTDHSLVALKLDLSGNLSASQSNSSSSSARATPQGPSHGGGNIASLLSSSSSSSVASKYARVLFSFLWIQLQELERRGSTVGLRVLVSPKQAKDLRKSDRVKSLFPISFESSAQGLSHAALAAFSSSASYFSSSRASRDAHAPLILWLSLSCSSVEEAQRVEAMFRLAQARANAESGRRLEEARVASGGAVAHSPMNVAQPTLTYVPRAAVESQIAVHQAAEVAPTPLLHVARLLSAQPTPAHA